MWYSKLEELRNEKLMYGELINSGALEAELSNFGKAVKEKLNIELPEEYITALKTVNGLEFNCFILYGIDEEYLEKSPNQQITGLISLNQIWYENESQKDYLFLGESNISWYVYKINVKEYLELDNPSGREMLKFKTFDEMFEKLITDSLL
ncbi:YrhA family protein [Paenibacillus sp. VCA1]|uniref:YrhA family protein n=1 Tax=Paenibacillus sp. VCA1 TaxID=3039148 RepID=UPI0028725AAD|nr:YrhA family protein [Paenibacillus sp. VCA1]MDR9855701.1 YrhA family protein [Paenibacillus sp. VCA1]